MTKELPGVIAEHIRGVNAIDTDAIVAAFPVLAPLPLLHPLPGNQRSGLRSNSGGRRIP
jgi:hypothetical protein